MSISKKLIAYTIAASLILVGVVALFALFFDQKNAANVFINLTSDRRFDQSIKVSILAAQKRTSVQNAVVIVDKVPEGETLEGWTTKLFNQLRLGRAHLGRAILYVYVPSQNALKIEVSYALESILRDAEISQLEDAAKSFTFTDRYHDFWAELINTINIHIQRRSQGLDGFDFSAWRYLSGGAGLSRTQDFAQTKELLAQFQNVKEESELYRPGKTPDETLRRYLSSLRDGATGARVSLLSTGSRIFRAQTPMNRAQLERNWRMYQEAGEPQIIIAGSRALALYPSGHPVLPIVLLRNKAGEWLAHEPNSWSYFHRFEDSMSVFQKFKGHPFSDLMAASGFTKPNYFIYHGAAPARAFHESNEEFFPTLLRLEEKARTEGSSQALFELADFYYFEAYLTDVALKLYREGLGLDEMSNEYRWRTLDLLLNLGLISEFLKEGETLRRAFPSDTVLQKDFEFFRRVYSFPDSDWRTSL